MVGQGDGGRAFLACLPQAVGAQAVLRRVAESERIAVRAVRPCGQRGQPAGVVARRQLALVPVALLGRRLRVQPLLHGLRPLGPALPEDREGAAALALAALHGIGQRALARAGGQRLLGQAAHVGDQRLHAAPDGEHGVECVAAQRIALLAPVVLRGLGLHGTLVGSQLFVEQAAAVERVFAQHALAPGVDGVDGRVVHAFGGHGQAPGGAGAQRPVGVGRPQRGQEIVAGGHLGFAAKALRGFEQARADAVGQLACGRARERHDQDLCRAQRPGKGAALAMAQHQAQVERGNGPGLAGAGAGLDQAAAPQRKIDGLQGGAVARLRRGRCGAHAVAPSAASTAGAWGTARTSVAAQCASGPYTVCASHSKRPSSVSASKSG